MITLIDTSSLIHFLRRKGKPEVKERVKQLLIGGDVATCDMVVLELHQGVGSSQDQQQINQLTQHLIWLPTTQEVWHLARELAQKCRQNGTPVPSSDILIAACAFESGAVIDAEDARYKTLANLK